jgi:ABC-type sulfate transport system permease component
MLAHAILKFLLCLSNVGLIAYLAGCFVYDTHFPAFYVVGTFSINFRRAVAVAGAIPEVARYDSIHKFPV